MFRGRTLLRKIRVSWEGSDLRRLVLCGGVGLSGPQGEGVWQAELPAGPLLGCWWCEDVTGRQ